MRALRAFETTEVDDELIFDVFVTGVAGLLFTPLRPALGAFQVRLDRVQTADPALRSGRAAWRATIAAVAGLRAPKDFCGDLERWRRTGFRPSAAPRYGTFDLATLLPLDRKFTRAKRRLRALGISRGAAERWAGDRLFDDLLDDAPAGNR